MVWDLKGGFTVGQWGWKWSASRTFMWGRRVLAKVTHLHGPAKDHLSSLWQEVPAWRLWTSPQIALPKSVFLVTGEWYGIHGTGKSYN